MRALVTIMSAGRWAGGAGCEPRAPRARARRRRSACLTGAVGCARRRATENMGQSGRMGLPVTELPFVPYGTASRATESWHGQGCGDVRAGYDRDRSDRCVTGWHRARCVCGLAADLSIEARHAATDRRLAAREA